MSQSDGQPEIPEGTEVFEQGDEAIDEETRTDPDFIEALEQDPSIDPTLLVDDRELEEAGVTFDDPEKIATLDGGLDDPDGVEPSISARGTRAEDEEGWDLDGGEADVSR